ncbi:MAG: Gfo/Idh/MocA family oxidoreductase [Candidatus Bathyarchaeota archaeon]|nr:Gfo/Idh/MocA family oxidoreductase [Candidatus Bathyarchaeota archaeon]
MNRLRVGVIGCGYIAEEAHLPNFLGCPRAELVAVADTRKERLVAVREKFGVKNLYTDYHDMLKGNLIDAVSICVPNFLHSQVAVDASEAGKHILCEKPMATTLDDADRMISAARKNNVKLMIGNSLRFLPNHELAREWVRKGKIGKVYFVRAQFASAGPYGAAGITSQFYFDPEKGGGVLFDAGSHLVDLLLWMFGNVSKVHACVGAYKDEINQADDVASVSMKFENGMIGEIFASWVSIQNWHLMTDYNSLQLLGSSGIMYSDFWGPYLYYFNEKSLVCRLKGMIKVTPIELDPKIPFAARNYAYEKEINSFVNCVLKNKEPLVTGEDGRRALKVIIDAYRSAKG